ncbi:MAG: transposase [Akkermansiaceae bacterium]|nr:transposase [Akkermansiaceae bacterium]
MPQSLARVYLHVVFSTKDRYPFLEPPALRHELHAYLGGVLKNLDCVPVEIGGVADHVHLLLLHPRTKSIAEVVKEAKRISTGWLQEQSGMPVHFHWQAGYGVFSVSQSKVEEVVEYIRGQEEHHRRVTFQDEYREFLRKHAVEFDEKYVWD